MDDILPCSASDMLAVAVTTRDSAGIIRLRAPTIQFVASQALRGAESCGNIGADAAFSTAETAFFMRRRGRSRHVGAFSDDT
ncbi:MAG TPA: hypothetical protein VN728_01960 [Stellaceae bacterium]|jgi:hypothetical protein|nr:hypothetical protein [Stellaceae bacterium]